MGDYSILGFFLFLGLIVVGAAILCGLLLSPRTPRTAKQMQPYECGIKTTGPSHLRFRVGYYLFALLFLIFDIETLFLFPAATLFQKISSGQSDIISFPVLIFDLITFLCILVGGLAYAWRKGALEWD